MTTAVNLGVGLVMQGKKVLLVDADPQGDPTISLGWQDNDGLPVTLANKISGFIQDRNSAPDDVILHHSDSVDLILSNLKLSALELSLSKRNEQRGRYDRIYRCRSHTARVLQASGCQRILHSVT